MASPRLVLLLTLCLCPAAGAEVIKYVDEKGAIHYTDRPLQGTTPRSPQRLREAGERYRPLIHEAARRYELSPVLIHAVILAESGYRADAVSSRGAVGLMQLMPATAQRYGVTDLRDPAQNIGGGTRYLRDLLARFNYDLFLTLAAYNAGEGSVLRYGGIPPYAETEQYVGRVLEHYRAQQSSAR